MKSAYYQPHAVISGYDFGWQRLAQHFVIQIGMHVGDDGAARLESIYPGQRVVDAEVAGMARKAKPINDPEIELLQKRPALGRDVIDIRRIGSVGDPVAQRGNIAMMYDECRQGDCLALPFDGAALA